MHVLHLIDSTEHPPCPMRLAAIADMCRAMDTLRQSVVLIGRAELQDAAERVGLPCNGRLNGRGLTRRALRRWLDEHRAEAICAWSSSTMALAQSAAGRLPLVCPDPHEPALDLDRLKEADRAALRQRWGVNESTCVVALVGRSIHAIDATLAGWVVGLVAHTPRSACLVIPPTCFNLPRARRMFDMAAKADALIVDPLAAHPWRCLGGCDLALSPDSTANFGGVDLTVQPWARPSTGGGLGLAWAMAAGRAVVVEDSPATRRHVGHEQNGLVADASPRAMAQAICRLIDEPALARRLGEQAAADASAKYPATGPAQRLAARLAAAAGPAGACPLST